MKEGELSPEEIEKFYRTKMSRRNFIKAGLKGGAAYAVARLTSGYLGGIIKDIIAGAEKEIREMALDIKALSGSLERQIEKETRTLKESYSSGKLKIFEELGIADPAEISQFEKIIENSENLMDHYSFAERASIFKDRINKKLITLDAKLESYQPGAMKKINDGIRGIFGKKTGKEGEAYRASFRKRLNSLCSIYDTNEDNRIAEAKVLEKLNEYVKNSKSLQPEERRLYEFLKGEYEEEGDKEHLRNFIKNYNAYSGETQVLLSLKDQITESEKLYENIKENKQYIEKLQGLLQEGIELKQNVREKSKEEFEKHEKEIKTSIKDLKDSVYGVIKELKSKGYDIETRADYINKGTFAKAADSVINPIVEFGSLAAGAYVMFNSWLHGRKNARIMANEAAIKKYKENYKNSKNNTTAEGGENAS